MSNLTADAIDKIERLVQDKQRIDHNGQVFVPLNYKVLRNIDKEDAVEFFSVNALKTFIAENVQGLDLDGAIITIDADLKVRVLSKPHPESKERTLFAYTTIDLRPVQFDTYHNAEEFAIALQTRFVFNENAKALFSVVSRIQIDEGVEVADDGMTQKVTVRKGMSAASAISQDIDARVILQPYRIYPELPQPESIFLIRLRDYNGPQVALFETDGGLWKSNARKIIYHELQSLSLPIYI